MASPKTIIEFVSKRRPVFGAIAVFVSFTTAARADFLSDVRGILTDPIKFQSGTSNLLEAVERTAIHVERIQSELNQDAKDQLAQIDTTVRETREFFGKEVDITFEKAEAFSEKTLTKVGELETDFFHHTQELLKCGTEVSAELVRASIAESLNDLGYRRPRLTLFGWTAIEVKFDKSDFQSPIEAFWDMKRLIDGKLKSIKETDPAHNITDLYAEVSRFSDLTRCHYKADTAVSAQLYEIDLEYTRRGRPWIGNLSVN